MQLSHTRPVRSAVFDDPNLVLSAGLVPVLALAKSAGLAGLADHHLSVPTDKGANAGLKVTSLVAGMVAGADSIDDMAVLRHGGMGALGRRLDHALYRSMRTTTSGRDDLTTWPNRPEAERVEHHRQRGRRISCAQSQNQPLRPDEPTSSSSSVDRGLVTWPRSWGR